MDILKEMEKIISNYKGKPVTISESTTFDELGFDSLDTVDLMMQVEDTYGVSFDDDMQISTLGELAQKIKDLKK